MTIFLEAKGRGSNKKQMSAVKKIVSDLLSQAGLSGEFQLTMTGKTHGSAGETDMVLVRTETSAVRIRVKADPNSHFQCFLQGGRLSPRQLWNSLSAVVPTSVGKNGGVVLSDQNEVQKTAKAEVALLPETQEKEEGMKKGLKGFTSRSEDVELAMMAIDDHLRESQALQVSGSELRELLAELFGVSADGRTFRPIFTSLCTQGHLILAREEDGEKFYTRPISKSSVSTSSGPSTETWLEKLEALERKVSRYNELQKRREGLTAELGEIEAEIARDGLDQAPGRLEEITNLLEKL